MQWAFALRYNETAAIPFIPNGRRDRFLELLPNPKQRHNVPCGSHSSNLAGEDVLKARTCLLSHYIFLTALAFLMLAQMWSSVRLLSVTSDEAHHFYSGYLYLQCGDFGWNLEHPPLANMVAALPLLAMKIVDPIPSPCGMPNSKLIDFQAGHDFVFANPESVLMAGRMAASTFAIGLLVAVWFFAYKMFGTAVAIISGVLLAFEPNIVGHGALVLTDVPAALGFVLAVYALYAYLSTPSYSRLALVGLATGFALCLKHQTALLAFILPLLAVADAFLSSGQWMRHALRNLLALLPAMIIALTVLWGVYGFRYEARPNHAVPWRPALLETVHGVLPTKIVPDIERRRLLPQAYVIGIQDISVELEVGGRSFLLGRTYPNGRWFYFPVATIIKLTLSTLLLLGASALAAPLWRKHKRQATFLLIPAVVLMASMMTSTLDIGIRHVLPLFPFLIMFAAAGSWSLACKRRWATIALVGVLIFHAFSSLRAFPNYVSYSNELWGGPANTYKYLSDSNTDMGQALKMARDYVVRNGATPCWLIQPFDETARDYGIPCDDIYVNIPPLHFDGTLIVSSMLVQGVMNPYGARSAQLFKGMQPKAKLGGSALFVYDGSFDMTPIVAAQRLKLATSKGPRDPQFAIGEATEVLAVDPKNGRAHAVLCYAHATLGEQALADQECILALKLMQEDSFTTAHDIQDVTTFMRRHGLRNDEPRL